MPASVLHRRDAFFESLTRWGVLRTPRIRSALEAVPDEILFLNGHGGLFAPASLNDLSPRLSVLIAELLELREGLRVHLPTPRPPLLAALVVSAGARIHDAARDPVADRAFTLADATPVPLGADGFSLRLKLDPYHESLTKAIPTGDGDAELHLESLPLRPEDPKARPVRQLLVVEGFSRRAIAGRTDSPQDDQFAGAVAGVWDPRTGDRDRLAEARKWFHLGYVHMFTADLGDAIELYRASLEAAPTAEAHTFLGWALSFSGDFETAIRECEAAIECDPGFGNPYNDIGAYLLELKRPEEALPWFARALTADRYDAPHFAHCNAGRALLELGQTKPARDAFRKSLAINPEYRPAKDFLERLPP